MSKKKKRFILFALAVVVLLGAGAIYQKGKDKGLPILAAKVTEEDIVSKVTANGKIQAENKVELSALVMGQIINLAVREGDLVKKDQFLLQIDRNRAAAEEAGSSAALKASLSDRDRARFTFEQAQRDYDRTRLNYEARITSEAEYQKAKSDLDTARSNLDAGENRVEQTRANLDASRDTLSKTTVRAPIDGIVTTLRVKAGEVTVIGTMNNPGTQLMTISDMASIQAVLMVDETDTPTVKVGQPTVLLIDAYPARAFEGVVTEVGHSPILRDDSDLQGLTTTSDAINFKVRVKLLHPPEAIRPGFSVTADIITGKKEKVPAVPLAAVVVRDSPKGERSSAGVLKTEEGVYALRDNKAVFTPVTTGITGGLMVELMSGLKPGEEIVTGPFKALREIKDGDLVKRIPEEQRKAVEKEAGG
jgi:HlyD family secretion protein